MAVLVAVLAGFLCHFPRPWPQPFGQDLADPSLVDAELRRNVMLQLALPAQ